MSLFHRFSLWLSKNPMQRSLYIAVPIVHLLLFIVFSQTIPPKKILNPNNLLVKTFTAPSASQPSFKAAPVQKKVSEPPKKSTAPPPKIKKTAVTKKANAPPVKKQNLVREKHLKELQERIAKIEAKNDRIPIKSELTVPTTLTLNSQQTLKGVTFSRSSLINEDLTASLISYLQAFLNLPELGEVQIQLALRKDGKIETMNVIKADSEKNRKYLEEQLPKLSFPQVYLDGSSSRSFLLTFCNKF